MRFPWITRDHHAEVLAAKEELIASLRSQITQLEEQSSRPVTVSVKLPDDFAVIQPALLRPARRQVPTEAPTEPPLEPIDWANVDENDPAAIAKIAAQELGGPTSPYNLNLTVQRIKKHIRESKLAKARALTQSGTVTEVPKYVPTHIKELIESAERA